MSNQDVAKIVQLSTSTVSMGNAFWTANEFLVKAEGGYVPTDEVQQYARAYQWNADTAAQKLVPLLERTWFIRALMPKLRSRDMTEEEAIGDLANEAKADLKYKNQIKILVDYGVNAGIISRDGNMLKLVNKVSPPPAQQLLDKHSEPQTLGHSLAQVTAKNMHDDQGGIHMQFNVHVSMAELSSWQPERIAAFFKGISDIISAKGKSGEAIR